MIDKHFHQSLQSLMRLHNRTPQCVTLFLAGSLPGIALVHLRILSNFGMITRKPDSILFRLGLDILSRTRPSSKSWFAQVRNICLLYQLPHPIILLEHSMTKPSFKSMVKKAVINYWETKLRLESAQLPSLKYFRPSYMSLTTPNPLWLSARASPYEVSKATV